MKHSELSYYRRPQLSNVVWLTPQQLDVLRNAEREQSAIERPKARSFVAPPVELQVLPDASSNENADNLNILSNARSIVSAALRNGYAQVHKCAPVPTKPVDKGVRSPRIRRNMSNAKKTYWQKRAANPQP